MIPVSPFQIHDVRIIQFSRYGYAIELRFKHEVADSYYCRIAIPAQEIYRICDIY
jgi:hypothetical protein